jgi:hypothetical protein
MNGNPFYEISVFNFQDRLVLGYMGSLTETLAIIKVLENLYPLPSNRFYQFKEIFFSQAGDIVIEFLNKRGTLNDVVQ